MSGGKHCYPGSDVLINKYNIQNKELLQKLEIQKCCAKIVGLDVRPNRVLFTYNTEHLMNVHKYLFGDIYEWAGEFRKENFYKSERVLSGGSAEYADYHEIKKKLANLFQKYESFEWNKTEELEKEVADFLLELWSIHPFREGNTRTCITFLWHYLYGKGIDFKVALLRNNPMYVRDSLVMANYEQKGYLLKIISDALESLNVESNYIMDEKQTEEAYQIAKADYEEFKSKYSLKREK